MTPPRSETPPVIESRPVSSTAGETDHGAGGSSKRCCCVHIGLPKTATTTLQQCLFPGHSQIEYLGKMLPSPRCRDSDVQQLITHILGPPISEDDLESCRGVFNQAVAPALDQGRVPLWSTESLSMGIARKRRYQAENFRHVFGDCRIIIVLRRPLDLLVSQYFQRLRGSQLHGRPRYWRPGRYLSVEQWLEREWANLERGELTILDYARTIEIYAEVFGTDSIGIFLYEQLVEDPSAYIRAICAFMGIDGEEGVTLTRGQRRHPRLTERQVQIVRDMNKSPLRALLFRFSGRRRRKDTLLLSKAGWENDAPKAAAEIPGHWKQRIVDPTREGNRWIMDRWGLPLDRYGYPA